VEGGEGDGAPSNPVKSFKECGLNHELIVNVNHKLDCL